MTKFYPIIVIFFSLTLLSCGGNDTYKKNVQPPNFVFILADDLGIGDVAAFNPESKIPTPHLNKLAREGMIFTDAHTSSSVCTPTRYGILTGRYNWRSPLKKGVLFGRDSALIDTGTMTIASLLKAGGYQTAFVGKWHLGWNWSLDGDGHIDFTKPITAGPNDLGFDYGYGIVASLDMPPYVYVENRHATAIPISSNDETIPATSGYGFYREGRIAPDFKMEEVTAQFFKKSEEYIRGQANSEKPFFLYLALPSPHTPILPTREWQDKSGLNPYGDFVMEIDHHIGRLLDCLDSLGISENTLVVFTSDNGCSPMAGFDVLAGKGHHPSAWYRGYKADIFEGGHRVPTIMRYPRVIPPGTRTDRTICLTDFYATLARLAGIQLENDQGVDSYSMVPLLTATSEDHFERYATVHSSINGSFAIRQGEWKLILCPGSGGWSDPRPKDAIREGLPPVQLYNLVADPGETENLYSHHTDMVRELYGLLMRIIERGRSTPGPARKNEDNGYGVEWTNLLKLQELKPFIASLNAE